MESTGKKTNYKTVVNVLNIEIDCSLNKDIAQAIGKNKQFKIKSYIVNNNLLVFKILIFFYEL